MKKIFCLVFGHDIEIKRCPVTDARLVICNKCGMNKPTVHNRSSYK